MLQVTILYKLYQTYQTPVSSPVSVPRPVTSGLESESGHSMYSLKTNLTDLDSLEITETRTLGRKPLPRSVGFDLNPENLSVTPLMVDQLRSGQIRGQYPGNVISLDQSEASETDQARLGLTDSAEKWNFPRTIETQSLTLDTKYLSL